MILSTKGLTFSYKDRVILKDVNITVNKGEAVGIVGKSGTGKSTLLRCLAGIIPHVIKGKMTGGVYHDGKEIKEIPLRDISKYIGMVFQNPDDQVFLPTVQDELAFGLENFCVPKAEILKRIDEVLSDTGMERYRKRNPADLSGGQKQLVALASVLCVRPEVLLFDEALSQIDGEGREKLLGTIKGLKDRGHTVIMVDHNIKNLSFMDKLYCVKDSGEVVQGAVPV